MLKALLVVARLVVTVPVLEFAGIALLTAAAWGAWSIWAGLATLGGLLLLKAFDLALGKAK